MHTVLNTTEDLLEVAVEIWPKWDSNPRQLNSNKYFLFVGKGIQTICLKISRKQEVQSISCSNILLTQYIISITKRLQRFLLLKK